MAKKGKKRRKTTPKRSSTPKGCHHIPPTSYDAMKQIFPGLEAAVKRAVKQFRESTKSSGRYSMPDSSK